MPTIERSGGGRLGYIDSERFEVPGLSGPTSALTHAQSGQPMSNAEPLVAMLPFILALLGVFALQQLSAFNWNTLIAGILLMTLAGLTFMALERRRLSSAKHRGCLYVAVTTPAGGQGVVRLMVPASASPQPLERVLGRMGHAVVVIEGLSDEDQTALLNAIQPHLPLD